MSALPSVPVMTKDIALRFCLMCSWTHEAWQTHKFLFDKNDRKAETIGKATTFTARLSAITQEYSLQQIAKLHDPATQGAGRNVSVDFVVKFGDWGDKKSEIEAIEARLLLLWKKLKPARNKLLAHNDLETLLVGEVLGEFPKGEDDLYFAALQELVDEVHARWVDGKPCSFGNEAEVDVIEFLKVLEKSPVN